MILEIAAGIILANVIAAIVFVFWRPILWLIGISACIAVFALFLLSERDTRRIKAEHPPITQAEIDLVRQSGPWGSFLARDCVAEHQDHLRRFGGETWASESCRQLREEARKIKAETDAVPPPLSRARGL
jgi:hypothetical protein